MKNKLAWRRLYLWQGLGAVCWVGFLFLYFETREDVFINIGIGVFAALGVIGWILFFRHSG
jgi:hypothetical protein